MSGPGGHQHAGSRFQIASRLGGFRDTVTLSDPFGTGAQFQIRRKGSRTHLTWGKEWLNRDPLTRSMMEEQILGEVPIILTEEELSLVESARKGASSETEKLLAVIDRLADTKADLSQNRTAIRRALSSGEITIADVAAGTLDLKRRMDEAAFLLSWWDNFPDQDGNPIPYSEEVVRELLTNDTPLEGAGMDDLLLSVEPWTIKVPVITEEGESVDAAAGEGATTTKIRSRLTFGGAYILWLHWVSERADLFKIQTVEAAAKNSAPPSDQSISSGGGTSNHAPGVS